MSDLDDLLARIESASEEELHELRRMFATRLAEVSIPDGQLVAVMVEGSPPVTAWRVYLLRDPPAGPQVDLLDPGDVPSILLSIDAAREAYYVGQHGPRLEVGSGCIGYCLRPDEPEDWD